MLFIHMLLTDLQSPFLVLCLVFCLVSPCRGAYEQQLAAAGGDPSAVCALLPSGIIVFRQGQPTQFIHHIWLFCMLLVTCKHLTQGFCSLFVILCLCCCREAYEQQLAAAGGIIVFGQGKLAQPNPFKICMLFIHMLLTDLQSLFLLSA
jgi:hypothetical protein